MNEKGFTLIEILIAVTITGIIMGSVTGFIFQGLHTWENLDRGGDGVQNIRILKNQLQQDLNRIFISEIYREDFFTSDYENLQWLIKKDGKLKKVKYSFDSAENRLVRREVDFDYQSGESEANGETMHFFVEEEIRSIDFSFYDADPDSDYWRTGDWVFPDEDDYLPSAVRLEIDLLTDEDAGEIEEIDIIAQLQRGREY
ncbi:MAG: PilW family protein [Halanaerobiaceae bacterium]